MEEDSKSAVNTPTPTALDGGFGWIVVAASFLAYFIADGWAYSFGIFYPEMQDVFNEGKGKTALIAALLYGVPLLISPVVCALTSIYGCRKIAITGGLITGVSFILSSLATSVDILCLTTGTLSSIGLAMTYIPSLLIVTFYFDKMRGLATGLAVTGSGLGAFAFPPLIEFLLSKYAWRGTLLILAGICFNIVVAGALFRPLPTPGSKQSEDSKTEDKEADKGSEEHLKIRAGNVITPRLHVMHPKKTSTSLDDLRSKPTAEYRYRSTLSLKSIHLFSQKRTEEPAGVEQCQGLELPDNMTLSSPEIYHISKSNGVYLATTEPKPEKKHSSLSVVWMETKLILKSMMDKSLLVNWSFLFFWASSFILFLWAGMPYVYLYDKATELGIHPNKAAFLLSIIGISRTFGQIALGILGDQPKIPSVQLYGASIAIAGIATLLVPFFKTHATLTLFSVLFGFFISVTYCLTMMALVDLVGLGRTTSAFGLLQMGMGISTLLGTPVAGECYVLQPCCQTEKPACLKNPSAAARRNRPLH